MPKDDLHVIVGLGASGLSCVRYLSSLGVPIAVTDTRRDPPALPTLQQEYPTVPLQLGQLDEELLSKASKIILSPGIALHQPAIAKQVKHGTPVIGDIELFAQVVRKPVIAITGTNAKSTVTTLVGKMAEAAGYEAAVGGNLGIPVLDLLVNQPDADLFVLELSSFQLETTHSLKSQVATVLNVSPDHMDRYQTLQAYQQAKHRIYQDCRLAVCNRDDPLTAPLINIRDKLMFTTKVPQLKEFGLREKNKEMFLAYEDTHLLPTHELAVAGKHYQTNALAALAIGYGFGLSFADMLSVLRKFQGLPHRCQFIREREQVKWFNDSKGTNVGATQAAIEGLGSDMDGKLIIIAGGVGKNADFTPLVPSITKYARHVILIGEAANVLAETLAHCVPISFAKTMDEAVETAAAVAKPQDSVLLSPACASFDMFKNFEHRGDVFMELVKKL